MSKSKINDFPLEVLLEKIGYKKYSDYTVLFSNANFLDVVTDFNAFQNINLQKGVNTSKDNPFEIMLDNPKFINNEKMILAMALNLNLALSKVEDPVQEIKLQNSYNVCLDLLKGSDAEIPIFSPEGTCVYVKDFISAKLFTREEPVKKNSHQKEINLQIVKKMEREGFFDKLDLIGNVFEDYDDVVCYDRADGSLFRYLISNNLNEFRSGRVVLTQNKDYKEYVASEIERILKEHNNRIDMNKFLLTCAANASKKLDAGLEIDEIRKAIEILEFVDENITSKNAKISTKSAIGEPIVYSKKILEEYKSRIIDSQSYISENGLKHLRQTVLDGVSVYRSVLFGDLTHQYWDLMNFSMAEKKQIIMNEPDNIEYIYRYDGLTKEDLRDILKDVKNHEFDTLFVDFLYEDGAIEKEDIINLYMNQNLSLSSICGLDDLHDLNYEITVDKLMKYYAETKENPNVQHDFERYMLLFKEMKVKNQSEERKSQIEEQIVERIYEINEDEYADDFVSLYQTGLLSIDTVRDWNGECVVYELIQRNELKPKDARQLLRNGEFDLTKAYRALKNSNLTETEKMNFIFGSFDGSGKDEDEIKLQNEARMYLIQAMNVSKELRNEKIISDGNFAQGNSKTKNERKRYLSDPAYRWRFYSELDDDCTYDNCLDGTVICTLPNLNGGTVFFEKIFKNMKNGVHINYGDAIYVISLEEYLKKKDQIVIDGKFSKRTLVEMKEDGKASKFIHAPGYGNKIKTTLNISLENDYDQERIQRIDAIIDKIEKSRELID